MLPAAAAPTHPSASGLKGSRIPSGRQLVQWLWIALKSITVSAGMAFDTLTYAKKLQEAGVPTLQAEAHAGALRALAEDNLATKQDLKQLETTLRHEIGLVRQELHGEIELVRRDMKEQETRMDGRFKEVDGRFRLLYWMVGFNLTLTLFTLSLSAGILLKLLAG
jgi:ribosomal protein L16 Arg81 hydroxylase